MSTQAEASTSSASCCHDKICYYYVKKIIVKLGSRSPCPPTPPKFLLLQSPLVSLLLGCHSGYTFRTSGLHSTLTWKVSRYCSMNGHLSQSLKIVKNVECRHLIFSLETDNEQDTQIRFDVLIGTTLKGRPWDRRQQLWLPQKMQAEKFSLDFLTKLQNAINLHSKSWKAKL